jgi:hypothetical protein
MRDKTTCRGHTPGVSTGPRTPKGRLVNARNLWKTGKRSKPALAKKSASAAVARALFACLIFEMESLAVPDKLGQGYVNALKAWEEAAAAYDEFAARIVEGEIK